MLVPVISDIHGNPNFFPALDGAGFVVCLGDYAGASGPEPDSDLCITMMRGLRGHFLAGNHDIEVLQDADDGDELTFVKSGVIFGHSFGLSEASRAWLGSTRTRVKTRLKDRPVHFMHSYIRDGGFEYLDSGPVIREFMDTIEGPDGIAFVGHTHVPAVHVLDGYGALTERPVIYNEWTLLEGGKKYVVNVGSTGDPRDGRAKGTYALLDTERVTVMFRNVR